ncbi:MAG: hypothetical protein U5K38_07665 [Woeseiaceae bacterium]|nr:hypothetical protein [Woeseiaceae bacterium]
MATVRRCRCNGHQDRAQAIPAGFDYCFIPGQTLLTQVIDVIDRRNAVVYDHTDQNHDADRCHERKSRAGRSKEKEYTKN